jgi:hypothetical protein
LFLPKKGVKERIFHKNYKEKKYFPYNVIDWRLVIHGREKNDHGKNYRHG